MSSSPLKFCNPVPTNINNSVSYIHEMLPLSRFPIYPDRVSEGTKSRGKSHIELPVVWGTSYACSGDGGLDILITGPRDTIYTGTDSCQSTSATRVAPQGISFQTFPIKLQTIKVTASASMVWHFQIAREVRWPAFRLSSDWVSSNSIGGNSSTNNSASGNVLKATNSNGQPISPKTWGLVFVCMGEGHGYIELTPGVGKINIPSCDGQPRLVVVRFPFATNVQDIQAFVSGNILWNAQVVACIDERKCGNIPAINLSPTHWQKVVKRE